MTSDFPQQRGSRQALLAGVHRHPDYPSLACICQGGGPKGRVLVGCSECGLISLFPLVCKREEAVRPCWLGSPAHPQALKLAMCQCVMCCLPWSTNWVSWLDSQALRRPVEGQAPRHVFGAPKLRLGSALTAGKW
jgi:hypothetical protein